MIDARDFLDAVAGYANSATSGPQSSASRPVRLGIIDPYYTSGPARVLFDGETVISDRRYSWVGSYTPVSSERVYLIPVGQTYLIGGKLASSVPYNVYHDLDMNTTPGGWDIYDTNTFHAPSFTKTEGGVVKLSGLIKHSTITGGVANFTQLASIPEGFRPAQDMVFPVVTSGNAAGAVTVYSDGVIATRNNCSGTFISFGNIVYPTQEMDWQTPTLLNGWELGGYRGWSAPAQYGKDSLDRVWLRGAFGESGTAKSVDTAVFNLPAGYRPAQGHYATGSSAMGSSGAFAQFYTNNTTGDFSWRVGSSHDDEVSIDGIYFADPSATWIAATFNNAWVSYGVGQAPGYYKDSEGVVHLKGLAKTGAINTSIFTLPVGYRPKKNIVRAGVSNGLANRLDVRSDGTVVPVTGNNLWVSLDGVSFTAEQ